MPALTFLGAARTVTGSRFLLEAGGARVLVDCGLFQGLKELRLRNWEPLPVPPDGIDAVVLTHAHIDHCGYLPRLVAGGFRGRVFCTPATADLCRFMLPDAARIAEEDAREANRHGYTRHSPALPLFTEADAWRALAFLQPVGFDRPVPVAPGILVSFVNSGHLLGSAFARLALEGESPLQLLFSGDVGRYDRPVLPDPQPPGSADVLILESTYGDRVHEPDDGGERLAAIVRETTARGGKLIIPAFAVGRVEEVIYNLKRLEEAGRIPVLPVFLDSPMAAEAPHEYTERSDELDPDVRSGRREVSAFVTARFQVIATAQQSADLVGARTPMIVISSSGMASGGRVLNHLEVALSNPRNTVLFTGYQAAGTRGRALVEGAAEVKIHGRMVPVAARIEKLESMSAHADSSEMLRWLEGFQGAPSEVFVVHGEPAASEALAAAIGRRFGWRVRVPEYLERIELGSPAARL